MWRLRLVPDARGCTESSLAPGLSAPHTLTRVPRAPEHQAPPSVPGGAIGRVLDCGDCGDFGLYQTLTDALSRVSARSERAAHAHTRATST